MDVISLGVEVQTKGAAQSAQQLGQFTSATKGAARAADTLEDQLRATASAQTQVATTARPMTGAVQGLGQAFSRNSSAIQNASFQLQDIIVQLSMGVPVTRTLGQQLPQLVGGFGPLGAVVGVAAGAFLSFLPMLMSTAEDAKTLQETLDDLSDTIGSMRDLSQEMASLEGLADKYGMIDAELVRLLGNMREQQALAAQNQAADAVKAIADEYRIASSAVNIFKITGTGAAADLADELGLTKNAFLALQAGIREAEAATTLEDQATAVAKIADVLSRATGANEDLVASAIQTALRLREAAKAGQDLDNVDLEGALGGAANQAARIADELGRAAGNALSAAANASAALQDAQIRRQFAGDPIGQAGALAAAQFNRSAGAMRGSQDAILRGQFTSMQGQIVADAEATARLNAETAKLNETMRGGAKTISDVEREAARLYESTRTEAERYAAELEKVEALFAVGAINGEVYSRALEDLNAKFDPFTKLVAGVADTIENELNSAFASVLKGTADLGDALLSFASNVLAKVAQDLFAQQFAGPIAEGIKGIFSANGNVFDAGGVTAFAKGGVVGGPTVFPFANGIGLMGEAGPEAIMPLSRGADGKLGVIASGGGAPSVTINNYSGQEASASSDSAGNIVIEIGRAIAQDITSGGPSYRAIRSTFGLSNRLQQRG
jgi:phage-related minor tail protein